MTHTHTGSAADANVTCDEITELKSACSAISIGSESSNANMVVIHDGGDGLPINSLTASFGYDANGYDGIRVVVTGKNILADTQPADAVHGTFNSSRTKISSASNAWVFSIPCKRNTDYRFVQNTKHAIRIALSDSMAAVGVDLYDAVSMESRIGYTVSTGEHDYITLCYTNSNIFDYVKNDEKRLVYSNADNENYTPYVPIQTVDVDFSGLSDTIYGGIVDVVSGKVISKYDASGELLETPEEYSLTPVKVTTCRGENYIWADAGSVAVEYQTDTKMYVDESIEQLSDEVDEMFDGVQESLTYDNVPTANSDNLLKSGAVYTAEAKKINKPLSSGDPYDGTSGQILQTNGDGTTSWVYNNLPTDEQTAAAVSSYFDENPSIWAEVQDSSLTKAKFATTLKLESIKDYVTPEMYGALGDGTHDDTQYVQAALDSGKPVRAVNTYLVSSVSVQDTVLEIAGTIKGQVTINNNATVMGGVIQQYENNPCVKFESAVTNKGYMNSYLLNCQLKPYFVAAEDSESVGIELYSGAKANGGNPLFGVYIKDVDIGTCDRSIYICSYRWITKCDIENVFCHSPRYAVFIDNYAGTNSDCADITLRNVFAQCNKVDKNDRTTWRPINFVRLNTGDCIIIMYDCFCYDGISEYYYYINNINADASTRFIMMGAVKNGINAGSFTNKSDLRNFYFNTTYAISEQRLIPDTDPAEYKTVHIYEPTFIKMDKFHELPRDYYGSMYYESYDSNNKPALANSRFFGLVGRGASIVGAAETDKVFGLSWYDGRLSLLRSTDGTVASGAVFEATTPYSGNVYTTATLPTSVLDGATCWCSDIHMAVTYYDGAWYKPDGAALSLS